MEFIPTDIKGVMLLKPKVFSDKRGYFYESYSLRELNEALGKDIIFVQDNESSSTAGVVRGLHFQRPPYSQSKLVRVIEGEVLDVAVDLRIGSPTYGRHISVLLSEANKCQLFIPKGFAHGFSVLSAKARFAYKCDNYYAPESEGGINCFDPSLKIDWKIGEGEIILSPKDKSNPMLKDLPPIFNMEGEAI